MPRHMTAVEFRHEYKASIYYPSHIAELKERLEEIDAMIGYHSPNLDGVVGVPRSHDERLAEYITKREKIASEIQRMEDQLKRIDGVLMFVDEDVRELFKNMYSGKMNTEEAAFRAGYDQTTARRKTLRQIEQAIKMYEDILL